MERIFKKTPLRIVDGIPVFSETDEYIENYDAIADDHLRSVDQGKGNPFMDARQIEEAEAVTRSFLLKHVFSGSRILDAGVGLGALLAPFSEFGRYGIDVSISYLKRARAKGFEVALSRIEDMPFPDSFFDAVVACDVLEHIIGLDRSVDQLLRVLKPEGMFIIQVPNDEDLNSYLQNEQPYKFMHVRSFNLASLRLYFEKIRGLKYIEHEYSGHQFNTAERLRIRLASVRSPLREFLAAQSGEMAELESLRRALAVSEEELADALISLRDSSPDLFARMTRDLIKPAEVTVVFQKPALGGAFRGEVSSVGSSNHGLQ